MENCSLCGREINKSYSLEFAGITLQPLCGDCRSLGTANPKKLVAEHRAAFEKIVAEHRASLPARESDPAASRLGRERALLKRYVDAYLVVRGVVGFGTALKVIGVVLGALIATSAFLFSARESGNASTSIVMAGLIFGGVVGVGLYAYGILVGALGQLVRGILDCAVNTSPFMGDDARARAMSLD